ncbi:MAG TPA: hypothetical protein VGQ21_14415 [Thermoanaerobaculia bacterium]|nr:hypothetical protein [Thermoanaerobaculia bacterium]
MKRHLGVMIAVIVILSPTVVMADFSDDFRTVNEVDRNATIRVRDTIEVRSLDGSLTPAQLDDFADLAEKGAGDIARFTGVSPRKQRILIYLSPRIDISHTYPRYPGSVHHEARVFIDSERVEHHTAPYLHELVHAVVGDGGSMWLEEGFASWVASSVATNYGGYYAPVLSGGNDRVDSQARTVIERSRGAAEAAEWFDSDSPELSQRDRRSFYILSHSFTKYLGNTLGTRRLVRIHSANNVRALELTSGISLDEWRTRWMSSLGESRGRVAAQR